MKEGRLDEKESPSGRSQFQFNKKAKKRGAFSGGGAPLFLGKIYGKYFIGTVFFKKHLYKPHKTRYNAVKTKKNNI